MSSHSLQLSLSCSGTDLVLPWLSGLNNTDDLTGSGGCKSKVKVSAGLIPFEGTRERVFSRPLSLAGRWCVSVQIPPFYKGTSQDVRRPRLN